MGEVEAVVIDVINRGTNKTRDKFGIVGESCVLWRGTLDVGKCLCFQTSGGYITTSKVQGVTQDDKGQVVVETRNTIYKFQIEKEM